MVVKSQPEAQTERVCAAYVGLAQAAARAHAATSAGSARLPRIGEDRLGDGRGPYWTGQEARAASAGTPSDIRPVHKAHAPPETRKPSACRAGTREAAAKRVP